MLSDEERKAIDNVKSLLLYSKEHEYFSPFLEQEIDDMNIVLNIVEKQSKEIEHQIEKRANQRNELAILNVKQVEFNKLVNTVNSYKGQFKKQQKEIEELKEENEKYKNPPFFDEENYTSKDKIKAKIKEINKEMLNEENSLELFYRKKYCKEVLQSLLEKE